MKAGTTRTTMRSLKTERVKVAEPPNLPKVASTVMSNPKFVSKSRLILGTNKYIGGTYRNTSLAQQQLNQSKSSAEIMAAASQHGKQASHAAGSSYDASNYGGYRGQVTLSNASDR